MTACAPLLIFEHFIQTVLLPSSQNGSTVQQAGGRINDEVNASLLLSALKNELKDSLCGYEIPMAVGLVDGPWTPETGMGAYIKYARRPRGRGGLQNACKFVQGGGGVLA